MKVSIFVYFSGDKACYAKRPKQNYKKFEGPVECCLYKKYQASSLSKLLKLNKGMFLVRLFSGSRDFTHRATSHLHLK